MTNIFRRLMTFAAVAMLTACGTGGGGGNDAAVVVADEVQVLDAQAHDDLRAFSLDVDAGAGEIRFAADSPFAAGVVGGAILVTEPVPGAAPHGFLQRVVSTRVEGDEIVLATEQATLEETFQQAEIDFVQELDATRLVRSELHYEGMTLRSASGPSPQASTGFDYDLEFDEVLIDDAAGSLELNGSFHFDATASARIDIDWFTLEHFSTKINLEESVDLELIGTYAGTVGEVTRLATLDFGTFTIWVGPVPVVFVLDMVVSVGANGTLEADLVASASQATELQVGAKYTDSGGWEDLNDFDSSFDWDAAISATAQARAFLRPQVNLDIYGLAGPFAYADAYVAADAELYRSPLWTLSAGLDFGVGFRVDLPVVGELARWQPDPWNVLHHELGEASNTAPTIEVVNETPGDLVSRAEGERVSLRVTAHDPEQREVVVELLDARGGVVDVETSEEGSVEYLSTARLCDGYQEFTLRVRDDGGAVTTTEPIRVDVVNPEPTVVIDQGQLGAVPAYPGKFYTAHAVATERSCHETGNVADQGTIRWFIDGLDAGSTADLQHRLSADLEPGDEFLLRAEWSDGLKTGWDETRVTVTRLSEGEMLYPVAHIRAPEADTTFEWAGTCLAPDAPPPPLSVEGVGSDADDGLLEGAALEWTLEHAAYGDAVTAEGSEASLNWCDAFADGGDAGFGGWTLTLTATDADGNTSTHVIALDTQPAG